MRWILELLGIVKAQRKAKPKLSQIELFEKRAQVNELELGGSYELVTRPILTEANKDFFTQLSLLIGNRPNNLLPPTLPETGTASSEQSSSKSIEHLRPIGIPKKNTADLSRVLSELKCGHFKQSPSQSKFEEVSQETMIFGLLAPLAPVL